MAEYNLVGWWAEPPGSRAVSLVGYVIARSGEDALGPALVRPG